MTNNKVEKEVRLYTLNEYYKMYPEEKQAPKSRKGIFGFGGPDDCITIFTGDTDLYEDYFNRSPARYAVCFGWYLPYDTEMDLADLPYGVGIRTLSWEEGKKILGE